MADFKAGWTTMTRMSSCSSPLFEVGQVALKDFLRRPRYQGGGGAIGGVRTHAPPDEATPKDSFYCLNFLTQRGL
jgi:hypothetical protein